MGSNSLESPLRSSFTSSKALEYSSSSSSISSPSKSSLAVSRHAPKWYSSKTTKSHFTSCSHWFAFLILPALSRPRRSWNDPKYTSGLLAAILVGSSPEDLERYCQPSKSAWDSRSVCHASSTAGLKVTTSTRLAPSFLASWYVVNVLPKRIFAFQRKRGTACISSAQRE